LKELIEVVSGDEVAPRHVAQVGPGRQKDGGGEFGQEPVRQIEVEVEAGQVPRRLLLDLVDLEAGKKHAPFWMIRMRQRHESSREEPLLADLLRCRVRQAIPRDPGRELDPNAVLHWLPPAHGDPCCRPVAEVVARVEQVRLARHDSCLGRAHPREDRLEILLPHGLIARPRRIGRSLGLGAEGSPRRDEYTQAKENRDAHPASTHVHVPFRTSHVSNDCGKRHASES
jgi:hypothetical protein